MWAFMVSGVRATRWLEVNMPAQAREHLKMDLDTEHRGENSKEACLWDLGLFLASNLSVRVVHSRNFWV